MLDIKDVNVYIGSKKIINKVSFNVMPGSIVGLVGPNGAGKTTIMKTILGLTKFTGQISMDAIKITESDHTGLHKVGALIEHPAIYPFLSGKKNLELYSSDSNNLKQIVTMLGMDSYINSKSSGYSLGMKQKLGIAMALINEPDLVILDEPMNGLDVEATISVRKIIKHFAEKGTAFLISSHVLSELQKVMTQILLINNGEIIVNDNMENFSAVSNKKYRLAVQNFSDVKSLFNEKKIQFGVDNNEFIINKNDVYKVQDIIYSKGQYIKELTPFKNSFEQVVVELLNKQRR